MRLEHGACKYKRGVLAKNFSGEDGRRVQLGVASAVSLQVRSFIWPQLGGASSSAVPVGSSLTARRTSSTSCVGAYVLVVFLLLDVHDRSDNRFF